MNKHIFIFSILFLFSCVEEKRDKSIYNAYYESGNLRIETVQISDNNFLVKEYYEDGMLKSTTEKNAKGIEYGKFELFYPNGILEQRAFKKNGILNGIMENYYDNGKPERSVKIKDGKPYGCCDYKYRKNGSLRKVGLYTFAGDLIFVSEYDSQGNLNSTEGNNLTLLVNRNKLKVGEKIKLEIDRYLIPNTENETFLQISRDGNFIQKIQFDESNVLTLPLNSPGNYKFTVKSIFNDKDYDGSDVNLFNGTLEIEIAVDRSENI
jgi:hypothetical protein